MKAISVRQPWAWAIADGWKPIENRTRIGTWRPAVGRTIAVHAAKAWSTHGASSNLILDAWSHAHGVGVPRPAELELPPYLFVSSAIIGTVRVVDVHEDLGCCAPWGESSYTEGGGRKRVEVCHLVLEEPRRLTSPIDCAGALGLWTLPTDLERAVERAIVE